MSEYDLKALREAGERAAREAYVHRQMIGGAVNWGDLHCVAALRVEDDEGRISYRVEIEEVAPDAGELQKFIHEQLKESGFPDVEVYTEW